MKPGWPRLYVSRTAPFYFYVSVLKAKRGTDMVPVGGYLSTSWVHKAPDQQTSLHTLTVQSAESDNMRSADSLKWYAEVWNSWLVLFCFHCSAHLHPSASQQDQKWPNRFRRDQFLSLNAFFLFVCLFGLVQLPTAFSWFYCQETPIKLRMNGGWLIDLK